MISLLGAELGCPFKIYPFLQCSKGKAQISISAFGTGLRFQYSNTATSPPVRYLCACPSIIFTQSTSFAGRIFISPARRLKYMSELTTVQPRRLLCRTELVNTYPHGIDKLLSAAGSSSYTRCSILPSLTRPLLSTHMALSLLQ